MHPSLPTLNAADRDAFVATVGHAFERSPWIAAETWERRPFATVDDLTTDSANEQASAGIDRLSPEEFATFTRLNAAYRDRFGFPFIICVREHDKGSILTAFEARLAHERDAEIDAALAEIAEIARLRLAAAVGEASAM